MKVPIYSTYMKATITTIDTHIMKSKCEFILRESISINNMHGGPKFTIQNLLRITLCLSSTTSDEENHMDEYNYNMEFQD